MENIKLNLSKSIFNYIYYPYLWNYGNRYEVFYGGSGSGKSIFVTQKLVLKAINSKRKVLIVRKVGNTNRDSTWQTTIDCLHTLQIADMCRINKTNQTIDLPNGSLFLFKGLDDAEKIKSITNLTDIWVEECTEINLDEMTQLDLRLRANEPNLQMYFTFNPTSKANWVYKRWFQEKDKVIDNTFILHTNYTHNRFLPQSYIDSLLKMKETNPTYYAIYTLGNFASLDKLIYSNWKEEEFNKSELIGDLLIGMDFGFVNDASTLIASILDEENKIIYIFDEFYQKGCTNDVLAKMIIDKGYLKSTIIADCAEPKSIQEIKSIGVRKIKASKKGKDSIIHGIDRLLEYKLIVHPRCIETIVELQNYSWKKDKSTGEYMNTPIDDYNHCLDALRYSLQCKFNKKIKTLPKSVFGL